jgi:hypothetical protein
MTQRPEMHGPPRYLTPDWDEAPQERPDQQEAKP